MKFVESGHENIETIERIRRIAYEKLQEFESEAFFIDSGGVGKVYQLPEGYCLKIIEDRHNSPNSGMFTLGNTPLVEAKIQEQVAYTQFEGLTRVPKMLGVFNAEKLGEPNAIIMERLNAVNLQHVIKDKAELPESFSIDDFFTDLEKFVNHMHKVENVVHLDLFARNIMIDSETGAPRVIDFGRANRITDTTPDVQRFRLEDDDWNNLDKAYNDIDKKL